MQRYISIDESSPKLSNDDIHHVLKVMRSKIGDRFEINVNKIIYLVELSSYNPFSFNIIDINKESKELKNDITLFYALSKGDKNEFVIQKATELGAKRIILLSSKRSVVKMNNDDFNKKKVRYEKIIKEASEQSKRNEMPIIDGIYPVDKIPNELLAKRNFVAYELDSGSTSSSFEKLLSIKDESISVLIGSEGGIDDKELAKLEEQGFERLSLGKRILRTETAAVYALSVLGFILERKDDKE